MGGGGSRRRSKNQKCKMLATSMNIINTENTGKKPGGTRKTLSQDLPRGFNEECLGD